MSRACSTHGRYEKFIQIWVGKPEGKRPLLRPGHRWEDNIKNGSSRNREVGFGLDSGEDFSSNFFIFTMCF
jgi:hypothetical protein